MKKTILFGIGVLAMAAAGCSDSWNVYQEAGGYISPLVGIDHEAVTPRADALSRATADAALIDVDDLSLRLSKADGKYTNEWPLSDFPVDQEFVIGEYTLEAFYGDIANEGFEKPAYYGSQSLVVADGKATEVFLTASVANSLVELRYTDAFTGYMTDWSASVNGIEYVKDETRPVYVTPGPIDIRVSVTKPNGIEATFSLDSDIVAKAGYKHIVTIDVNDGNVGDAALVVTFDENMEKETIEIDLSDKLLSSAAPVAVADGFEHATAIELVEGMIPEQQLAMNITALAGLAEVNLTTSSASLLALGWPAEINLMAASAAQQATLTSLGLEVIGLWNVTAEMAVVDFSKVVKNIRSTAGQSDSNIFTLTVKDKVSRVSEPLELNILVEEVKIGLSLYDSAFVPGQPFTMSVAYNGTDLADNVSFEYFYSHTNTWRPLETASVEKETSRATANYLVAVTAPDIEGNLRVRAKCNGKYSNELSAEIAVVDFALEANENNVFATKAYLSIVGLDGAEAPALDKASFYIYNEATLQYTSLAHTVVDGLALISGLTPGTKNTIRVRANGLYSDPIEITTESATPLENANMLEWTSQASSSNCVTWYPGGSWSTYNPVTMSQVNGNYAYKATSGTKSTTDAVEGNAALIRTVGWGSGNTAAGSASTVKYVDAGQLFLGNWDGVSAVKDAVPNYGIAFASRPSALSFSYKFSAVKSRNGLAEVYVYDAAGNTIASNSFVIEDQGSYIVKELPLAYAPGAAKAARISVIFRSGPKDVTLSKNDVNTGFMLGSAEHVGSQLYIDNIELKY